MIVVLLPSLKKFVHFFNKNKFQHKQVHFYEVQLNITSSCKLNYLQLILGEMIADKSQNIKANRLRLRQSIKLLQFKNIQQGSPVKNQEPNPQTARQKRKRRASQCIKSFDTMSTFKDMSVKESFEYYFYQLQKLGQGAHSVVYKCQQKSTQKFYAVKVTKQKDLELMENMRQCYEILKALHHESIIKGFYLFINTKKLTCHLVSEIGASPTLKDFIVNQKKNKKAKNYFSEEVVAPIIQSLLDCLSYLYDKGVCHRDIKPDNILYDPASGDIKLIDFQIAKMQRYSHQKLQLWSNTGTLHYRAPQTFKGGYGILVDTWSVGIICYQMLVGDVPYKSLYIMETITEILQKDIDFESLEISLLAKVFLKKILQKNPQKRLNPKEALSNPFILKNSSKCSLQSPSRLNSSFQNEENESEEVPNKFYDQSNNFSFLSTISEDIGVRFCQEEE